MEIEFDDPGGDWTRPGVFEVSAGVYRIPLPLPSDGLRAVNVYALRTRTGLVVVDSGWALAEAREAMKAALGALDCGFGDVDRYLITHVHRDHYTMAVLLRREFGSRILLGRGEEASLRHARDANADPWGGLRLQLRRAGADDLSDRLTEELPPSHVISDWEPPDEWVDAPVPVKVGDRALQAIATPGHTQGHVVFLDSERGDLYAGDHVLPHITPSIGFEPAPAASPLRDYLRSLRAVRALPDQRFLPAHGPVSPSTHRRIDQLLDHHGRRLDEIAAVVEAGCDTARLVAGRLGWTRRNRRIEDLDLFNQCLAVTETLAHLDVLVEQGRLTRTADGTVEAGLYTPA
ncbi:MBL fold metallo-hydrolase [Actinacidiphila oryziradicis]|uniref:MBL fold metallo-hydrolase n=1 Tax=Actinacidiphila oryziradicis TaxID=2571141 RepID=A0A4U0S752_9ACTN|nr:MBL fold metallo-hydrolase [Actinacidiphila oryziradicis]TKA04966.1 MBL fold metallo-hydrolase [Actinacidiphila oryziradicis]